MGTYAACCMKPASQLHTIQSCSQRTLTGKVMWVATFSFHLVPTPKRLRCMMSTRGSLWKRSVRVAGVAPAHVSQWNASSPCMRGAAERIWLVLQLWALGLEVPAA